MTVQGIVSHAKQMTNVNNRLNKVEPMISVENVSKSFTLHNQGAAVIPVMRGGELTVARGECVALTGASGAGKSTLMRMIYGNYRAASGQILVGGTDLEEHNVPE